MGVCIVLACTATAIFALRSLQGDLWLDELLSLTLLQATSLPKLWAGITSGIDGNPPLYLTLAWLLTHVTPPVVSSVAVLKAANVIAAMAAVAVLYRAGLRVASATACWIGAFVFAALNENLVYVAFELRTYALYFLLATLSVLFLQRLIAQGRRSDLIALAVIMRRSRCLTRSASSTSYVSPSPAPSASHAVAGTTSGRSSLPPVRP